MTSPQADLAELVATTTMATAKIDDNIQSVANPELTAAAAQAEDANIEAEPQPSIETALQEKIGEHGEAAESGTNDESPGHASKGEEDNRVIERSAEGSHGRELQTQQLGAIDSTPAGVNADPINGNPIKGDSNSAPMGESHDQAQEQQFDPDLLKEIIAVHLQNAAYSQPQMGLNMVPDLSQSINYFGNGLNGMGFSGAVQMNGLPSLPQPYLDPSPNIDEHVPSSNMISAYAKLSFPDGEFYMTTYSVILGRDLEAYNAALRHDEEEKARALAEASLSRAPETPVRIKREESRYSRSIISESGGILREGDDPDDETREQRRKARKAWKKASKLSKKSKSASSSSRPVSRRNSLAQRRDSQPAWPLQAQTAGAVPVDPVSLQPDPNDCPIVAIHPPASAPLQEFKSISRQHVKIAYNTRTETFEATVIGRNGCFINEVFVPHAETRELEHGCRIQISSIEVTFELPDNVHDHNEPSGQDRYSEGGKEMSFDFESDPRGGLLAEISDQESDTNPEDSEEDSEKAIGGLNGTVNGQDDDEDQDEDQDEDEEQEESSGGSQQADAPLDSSITEPELEQPNPAPPKKRGPGRPPKDGIMSKREKQEAKRAELAKQQEQLEQKSGGSKTTSDKPTIPGKNPVGRPRKHPLPEQPEVPRQKRAYKKRAPKEPKEGDAKDGEGEGKEKKEKKPPKPPKSPSPELREEDFTPEQLAKPQANYVQLIYEALSNCESGQMSLPQLYKAIARKYPYFICKVSTLGWQSSVRHNLSQNNAFKKVERDGKGWMWAIEPGVSIEKEKKSKPTPPMAPGHMHPQPIYQAPPHMMPGYHYGPQGMIPPPGYMAQQMPQNMRPGQPPPYYNMPPYNGHQFAPPMTGPPPGYPPMAPQLPAVAATSVNSSYSSPYAPKPPANDSQSSQQASQQPGQQAIQQPGQPQIQQPSQQSPTSDSTPNPHTQSQSPAPIQSAQGPYSPVAQHQSQHPPIPSQPTPGQHLPDSQHAPQQHPTQQPAPPPQSFYQSQPASSQPPHQQGQSEDQSEQRVEHQAEQKNLQNEQRIEHKQEQLEQKVEANVTPKVDPQWYPQHSETVLRCVEIWRTNMMDSIGSGSTDRIDIAIDRVLGRGNHGDGPIDPEEQKIMNTLRNMLKQVSNPSDKPSAAANQSATQPNASPQQPTKSTGPPPSVPRPSFNYQGQRPPARPPMMLPNVNRANSGSPGMPNASPRLSVDSPAPTISSFNGVSTVKPAVANENGVAISTPNGATTPDSAAVQSETSTPQIAGQKRAHEDEDGVDDARDFKRMATSGPPQLKT